MKLLSMRALILVVISSSFLVSVTSCKKSSSGGTSAGLSATVNGTAWANNFEVIGLFSISGGEFEIGGDQFKGGDSTAIAIQFLSPVVLNHAISSDTAGVDVGYIDSKNLIEYDGGAIAGHSVLTITSYDSAGHKIGGTFSGVLYNTSGGSDSLIVTNGKFNTTFTPQ
jgi:hypothetical protein